MPQIRLTQNTSCKITPRAQSAELGPEHIYQGIKGDVYEVLEERNGHYKISAWIFAGHAEPTNDTISDTRPSPRRINKAGIIALIKKWEGLKLTAYLCPANVWTIGYGHTATAQEGQTITEAKAEELLEQDLAHFERAVAQLVKVPLLDNQFSALVSFAYNVGVGAFKNSTLLKVLNRGDYDEAANQLDRWVFADGRKQEGLIDRRAKEKRLFKK